jgi:hypothetical protein
MPLVVCSGCDRHIRPAEVCPYCQVLTEPRVDHDPPWRPARVLVAATLVSLAAAGCGSEVSRNALYGSPEPFGPYDAATEAAPSTPPLFDAAPEDAAEAGEDAGDASDASDSNDSGASADADAGDG